MSGSYYVKTKRYLEIPNTEKIVVYYLLHYLFMCSFII